MKKQQLAEEKAVTSTSADVPSVKGRVRTFYWGEGRTATAVATTPEQNNSRITSKGIGRPRDAGT